MSTSGGEPQVGERWRWSYCDGPDWCCGDEGVVIEVASFDGKPSYEVLTREDPPHFDAFQFTDDLRRAEKISDGR